MGFNFLQIADCYIDRSTQVNFEVRDVGLGSSIAKRDNFSTQRSTLQISGRMPAARLINR